MTQVDIENLLLKLQEKEFNIESLVVPEEDKD